MSRRKPKPIEGLEWPEWLVVWQSQDVPYAPLADSILKRMRKVGVTTLKPADTAAAALLEPSDHERADGIGVAGPGFAFAEPVDDEPAAVAAALSRLCEWVERFDELRSLRLGAIDMELVAHAAEALADEDGPARQWDRVIETGLVVTYARPYLPSEGRVLGRKRWPEDPARRELHERLITTVRSPYHAHTDRTPHRTLVDTTVMLGLSGPPVFSEGWSRLNASDLARMKELAEHQASMLHAAADEIGSILGEKDVESRHRPTRAKVTYTFDDGIEAATGRLRETIGGSGGSTS